jgi:hypothetical protein
MEVELARQQWEDGVRRIEATAADRKRHRRLLAQVDVVAGGLRQRVGQVFTLAELADAYDGADEWARALLDDADPEAAPAAEPGTVADAAFHLYARGASDYSP